jgi:hypothetical protein
MATQWVNDDQGGRWVDTGQQSLEALLAKYGLAQVGGFLGAKGIIGSPDRNYGRADTADYAGFQADPEVQKLLADGRYRLGTEADWARMADPDDPENNQGGSDLANIMRVLAFAAGGAALTGGLAGLGGAAYGGAEAAGFGSSLGEFGGLGAGGAGVGGTAAGAAGSLGGIDPFGGWNTLGEAGLGGSGGSGLSQAAMDALTQQAQQEIATGAAGSVGVNSAGSASWLDLLMDNPASAVSKLFKSGGAGSGLGSALGIGIGSALGGGSLLGALGTGIAGLYGAKVAGDQTDAYKEMAEKYAGYGAPYRQRLSDLYADPSSFLSSPEVQKPVQMGTDMLMRSLSTQGNPFGSGNALQQGQSYASDQLFSRLGQERDRLGGFGGLSSYNQAAPQMSQNAITSMSAAPTVLAGAVSDIFHPQPTFAETMKQFQTLSGR